MPETKFWAEMTWTDFETRDMASTIAVLPIAATEQHGPHLPLGTDTFIMEGYIAQVVPRLPDELAVLFLPVQNCTSFFRDAINCTFVYLLLSRILTPKLAIHSS